MRKTRILFTSLLTTSLLPVFASVACANVNQEEAEVVPESISLTYGDGLTEDVMINENETLEFKTQVFPETFCQDVEITSENRSVAIIEDNKLIPKGIGSTKILANPVGYPGLKAQVNVTILESENLDKIDETNVVNDGKLIGGLSDTYGIVLKNFKADFVFGESTVDPIPHMLTSKIIWTSEEDMEDDAAGITDIKVDNFNNTTFSTVCSFKSNKTIEIGHEFKFKLKFFVDSGTTSIIEGTREYSITYDGDNDYAIDDSEVEKNIDFKDDDNKFAIIRGYKAPFYFGEGSYFDLTAHLNLKQFGQSIESIEIMNKVEVGGYTTFDLGIHTVYPLPIFNDVPNNTISFALNGIDVLISTGYTISKTDTIICTSDSFNILKDGEKSKVLIEGIESNFDFSANELQIVLSMSDTGYPDPTSYNIIFVNDKEFNVEFYWNTLLTKFDLKVAKISFFINDKHLVNSDYLIQLTNVDDEEFVRFVGDTTLKVCYDSDSNKYFTKLIYFECGPKVDLESGSKFAFVLSNQDGIEITTSFFMERQDLDGMLGAFVLLMYWDEKPEMESDFYLDVTYNGAKKIDLLLSFVEPDPNNFYALSLNSNVGSIDILKNKQDETIELGIKVNLAENQLMGLDFRLFPKSESQLFYSLLYSFDYNSDPSSPYKILVHIYTSLPDYNFVITGCDTIILNAIFAPNDSNFITLSADSTSSIGGMTMLTFKTQNKVTIYPNTTYYIKASISAWASLQEKKDQYGYLDQMVFVCGEDISSDTTCMSITGEFIPFCNHYVLANTNYSTYGYNIVSLTMGTREMFVDNIWTSEILLVWTPKFSAPVTIDLGICAAFS